MRDSLSHSDSDSEAPSLSSLATTGGGGGSLVASLGLVDGPDFTPCSEEKFNEITNLEILFEINCESRLLRVTFNIKISR